MELSINCKISLDNIQGTNNGARGKIDTSKLDIQSSTEGNMAVNAGTLH